MTIELLRHDAADQEAQLFVVARRRKCRAAQVVLQVEVRIVDPDGATELERHEANPLPVAGNARQVRPHPVREPAVRRGWPLEDRHRADVHVADPIFEVQERRVL